MNNPGGNDDSIVSVDLSDLWGIILKQRRIILGVFGIVLGLALTANILATPIYKATSVVRLAIKAGQEVKSDKVVDIDQYNRWNRDLFSQTQIEVVYSQVVADKVMKRYHEAGFTDDELISDANQLSVHMLVQAREGTELIDISVDHTNPEQAAVLANLVSEVYREINLNSNRDAAKEAKLWILEQLAEYEIKLKETNDRIANYQREHNLANASSDLNAINSRLESLNVALAEKNTEQVMLTSKYSAHKALFKQGAFSELAKEMQTPLTEVLVNDYAHTLTEHARLTARYGPKHPKRQSSTSELSRIEEELKREVNRTIKGEKAQLTVLDTTLKQIEDEITKGNEVLLDKRETDRGLKQLNQELTRTTAFYETLGTRHDELEMQARTQLNNVQIIDAARAPESPYKPATLYNMVVALLLGLLGGCSLGFLKEYFSTTITSPADVKIHLKVPYLGHVPLIDEAMSGDGGTVFYTHYHGDSGPAEAIRSIRTLLDLNPERKRLKRILVTSAISAEGKTGTSVRLGIAFARLGRKVLIVDADLRRPNIHKVFKVKRFPGLTEVFSGKPVHECLLTSEVANLSILPSGNSGERGKELLASNKMVEILDSIQDEFDHIIVDTSPAGFLADAAILSRGVDGVLFVVREYTASRKMVQDGIENLQKVGATILGVVINAVDLDRHGKSYSYYGYGYGYGYKYKYTEDPIPDGSSS